MHIDGKVVPINKAQATPSPLARLPVVLLQVRDKAAQQLQQGLQELFDNADDTLFDLALEATETRQRSLLGTGQLGCGHLSRLGTGHGSGGLSSFLPPA